MLGLDATWVAILAFIFLAGTAFFVTWVRYRPKHTHDIAESRYPSIIQQWAKTNDYEIRALETKKEPGQTRYSGPFGFQLSYSAKVYRVVVTKHGEEKRRAAWIRVGDDFKVIWEDEWRPQEKPIDER